MTGIADSSYLFCVSIFRSNFYVKVHCAFTDKKKKNMYNCVFIPRAGQNRFRLSGDGASNN